MFNFIKTITKDKQRITALVIVGAVASTIALVSGIFLGPDNPIEEASEAIVNGVVEESTGVDSDSDFSPGK